MVDGSIRWGRMALAAACAAALALGVVVPRPPKAFAEEANGIEVVSAQPISLVGDGGTDRGRGTFDDTPVVSYVGAAGAKGSQECSILDDSAVMPIKGGWWLLDADTVAKDKVIEVLGDAHFVCSGSVELGTGYIHVAEGATLSLYAEVGHEGETALYRSDRASAIVNDGIVGYRIFPATITERPRVTYLDEDGAEKYRGLDRFECDLSSVKSSMPCLNDAWYYVSKDTVFEGRVEVIGNATIVICDGATLRCLRGIHVPAGKALTILGQAGRKGKLVADASEDTRMVELYYATGIGGNREEGCGIVTICDTNVSALGGVRAAGIGGGDEGCGGKVVIRRSHVEATGGNGAAGIGGGGSDTIEDAGHGGTVIISDSVVTAKGNTGAAGIGGGAYYDILAYESGDGGDVTIEGSSVVDASSDTGAAIGRGRGAAGVGSVHISDNLKVTDLSANVGMVATFDEREGYCLYRNHVRVEPGESRK